MPCSQFHIKREYCTYYHYQALSENKMDESRSSIKKLSLSFHCNLTGWITGLFTDKI